ncbi:MAG: hypothetical protein LM632_07890, partial [Armatimonadetes bacterium]|nr:hypothetical protein [Armatimonadota bacterium]
MASLEVETRVSVREAGVSLRAVLLGLIGTVVLAWLVPIFDLLVQGTWIASCHLPIGVFNLFMLLLVGNALLKTFKPRWSLTRRELLVAYCTM